MDSNNDSQRRGKRVGDTDIERHENPKKPKWQLPSDLASWSCTYKVKADCVTALLKTLRQYDFPDLMSDSRSLLKTPRDTRKMIRNVEPGEYIHIGIAEGIKYTLRQNEVDINKVEFIAIDYNTDGVQMTDSTDNVFWPIWCRLGSPRIGKPFLTGNYYSSTGQPKSFDAFMLDFVNEFKALTDEGLKIGFNKVVEIRMGIFLGDAPARCDVLGLKYPTGYYGCGRCTVIGTYANNRVCFTDLDAPLRTDKNFQERLQPEHHHISSLVEKRLELRCITQSPLDGMHLVYGCAVRRLLFWYNTDTVNYKLRLSATQIDLVNDMLNTAMLSKPREFARPVRDIKKYKKFKCTQLRQFLLYLSVVAMKKVLPKFQYEHLLLFVIGIRILSDEKQFKRKNEIAEKMLYEYVKTLRDTFGKFRLIYSTHNLLHLANECLKQNAPLDAFSMWEFETANSGLKEFTKRQGAYLEQSYNRTMEKYHKRFDFNTQTKTFPSLSMEIDKEYDEDYNVTETFFYRVEYKTFMLDSSDGNRWFLTKFGHVGRYDKAILKSDKIKIRCQVYKI
ncbi:uncharacterized protein LOC119077180 [Bradysia coprophila]|uniref:uncharacterized protein LOC119077180 n=1 Tax=Bradysia coprophila TaxID=38358 RepID=UPI00187DB0D8|nr:uncharacterized protein LOC119077180 [Bradysia coprophila]